MSLIAAQPFSQELLDELVSTGKPFVFLRDDRSNRYGDTDLYLLTEGETKNADEFIMQPFNVNQEAYRINNPKIQWVHYNYSVTNSKAEINRSYSIKESYTDLIEQLIKELKSSEKSKIVASRCIEINGRFSVYRSYLNLLNTYKETTCYLWWHPDTGYWMGATPETLIHINDGEFTTMALAGTRLSKDSAAAWGSKEKEEQQLVTDYLLKKLNSIDGLDSITAGEPHTVQAGTLEHIRTDITGVAWSNNSIFEIAEVLHPTPAVAGMPQQEAVAFINEHEGYDRKLYTGYFGYYNNWWEQTSMYVNLRCMQITDIAAYIYVGGGITVQSDPLSEYEETCNKAVTMLDVLSK